MLLVVYGTLREGEALSSLLNHLRHRSVIEIIDIPLELYVVGECPGAKLPGLIRKGEPIRKMATVELWDINISKKQEDQELVYLDLVERVKEQLYQRSVISTPKGKAWVYTYVPGTIGCTRIYDWKEYQALADETKFSSMESMIKNSGFVITSTKHTYNA